MSILVKGTDFGPTEQVTSTKLDNLVDAASFTNTSENAVSYTGSTGTCLQGGGLEVTSAGQLQVKDGEITTVKLNDNAVTTAKITDLNVTTAKIAADAITTAKIADDVELGGNPTTTTQSAGDNSTKIATTAYVDTAIAVGLSYSQLTLSSFATTTNNTNFYQDLTGFTINNQGVTLSESSGAISVPAGTYVVFFSVKEFTNVDAAGGSAVQNQMKILRDGTAKMSSRFDGAEGQTFPGESMCNVFTGGVDFKFQVGQRNTSNAGRGTTATDIIVTFVKII